jgi:hypothetical protein
VNYELAMKVADAVLYEGYMLYPYRRTAIKNRQRWSFGILYPPEYGEVQGGTERSLMHSEFLARASGRSELRIHLRFLHLLSIEALRSAEERNPAGLSVIPDHQFIENWEEGRERSVEFVFELGVDAANHLDFSFPGGCEIETIKNKSGEVGGNIARTQYAVNGTVGITLESLRDNVVKLTIEIVNLTALPASECDRNFAILRSLVSAHTILTLSDGEFVSLLDPPEDLRAAVNGCRNVGNFPVLVGNPSERDLLFCSPIILYDYPQVAPESAGDFYDATEIDEMLTLRITTLADAERDEMIDGDDRVRRLVERTEQTARDQLRKTHGIMRACEGKLNDRLERRFGKRIA